MTSQPLGTIPTAALLRAVGALDRPALLLSGGSPSGSGRFSILAAEPWACFQARGTRWTADRETPARPPLLVGTGLDAPLDALAEWLESAGLASTATPPPDPSTPFLGGAIGFFGYDLAPRIERLPRDAPRDSLLPDIHFNLYDTAVIVDHLSQSARLVSTNDRREPEPARLERLERWRRRILDPPPPRPISRRQGPLTSNFPPDAYRQAVRQALDYIAAGDVFQVNLSQRFEAAGTFDAVDLCERLQRVSPAPFSALLRQPDWAVVSASPESFYETRGRRIVTRPIKGTRPRGASPDRDAQLAAELRHSPKDRAELTMIVDLERNDLGRVCRYGSVRVTDPLAVESFAQVHHLVATIEGELRPDVGPVEIVRAVFPGGSITGAPKIRAMEIIDELEPHCRSLYTGAIGYYTPGASAFNIAIRTILLENGRATFGVGGGIVADSEPDREFEETLHKARGLLATLEGEGGHPNTDYIL